jgi:zinc protease
MNTGMLKLGFSAAVILLAACEPPAPPVTPPPPDPPSPASASGPVATPPTALDFRAKPPSSDPEIPFVAPKIEETKLPNGVRILVVERHELPLVATVIAVDHGADQGRPAIGGFVGAMLLQGSRGRSALQISDDLDKLGAAYGAFMDHDSARVYSLCLSTKLDPVMSILTDVVLYPTFAKDEIERKRSERLTTIAQQNDQPYAILARMIGETLYPEGHPYHTSVLGTEETVTKIAAADLTELYKTLFQPKRVTVAFAGDITKERATALVENTLGRWRSTADTKVPSPQDPPMPPRSTGQRLVLVDRPGSTQSFVSLALPGAPRLTKDYDALLVMNTILGGQFSSRLNLNLREKHAYTYGVRSTFDFRHGPGAFSAGGAIVRESTGPAVAEMLSELQRIRTELVTEDELNAAKSLLIRALPARFESASETAGTLAALSIYGLPLDEFATRPARLQRVTREDVNRVAQTYLPADGFRLLVVGDATAVKDQLAKVGLGEVTVKTLPKAAAPVAAAPKKK